MKLQRMFNHQAKILTLRIRWVWKEVFFREFKFAVFRLILMPGKSDQEKTFYKKYKEPFLHECQKLKVLKILD